MHRLGRIPPAEAEAQYYARLQAGGHTGHSNEVCMKPGMLHPLTGPVVDQAEILADFADPTIQDHADQAIHRFVTAAG